MFQRITKVPYWTNQSLKHIWLKKSFKKKSKKFSENLRNCCSHWESRDVQKTYLHFKVSTEMLFLEIKR